MALVEAEHGMIAMRRRPTDRSRLGLPPNPGLMNRGECRVRCRVEAVLQAPAKSGSRFP